MSLIHASSDFLTLQIQSSSSLSLCNSNVVRLPSARTCEGKYTTDRAAQSTQTPIRAIVRPEERDWVFSFSALQRRLNPHQEWEESHAWVDEDTHTDRPDLYLPLARGASLHF